MAKWKVGQVVEWVYPSLTTQGKPDIIPFGVIVRWDEPDDFNYGKGVVVINWLNVVQGEEWKRFWDIKDIKEHCRIATGLPEVLYGQ